MVTAKIMRSLVNNLLQRHLFIAIFLCCIYFFISLLSTISIDGTASEYWGNAITTDEMAHIPSGFHYLKTGTYFLNVEHPPLIKDLSALPLLLYKPYLPESKEDLDIKEGDLWHQYPPEDFVFSRNLEIKNAQWDWAAVFLFNPKNDPSMITFLARASVIAFNSIFILLLYVFLTKAWNSRIALTSLFLIIFSQFNIAHGSLVAMDFMSSLLQILSIISFSIFVQHFTEKKKFLVPLILASLFLSLAILSKFSSLILLPAIFIGGLIFSIVKQKTFKTTVKYLLNFGMFIILSLVLIFIYYYIHTLNMDSADIVAQLNFLHPEIDILNLNEILTTTANNQFLKGVTQFSSGIIMVASRMDIAYQQIYFMGTVYGSEGAGILYFPVLYLTKMPVGLLLLNIFGVIIVVWSIISTNKSLKRLFENFVNNPLAFFFLIFIYFFLVATISSNLQIGLRHILPIILSLTILTALVIDPFWNKAKFGGKTRLFIIVTLSSIFISVILSFPNYIEYYNMIGGGTRDGYKIATDSNYDWGQGIKSVVQFTEDNNINQIFIDVDAEADIPFYWYLGDTSIIIDIEKDPIPSPGSYLALSMSNYEFFKSEYGYMGEMHPQRIDETIMIIQIPHSQIK